MSAYKQRFSTAENLPIHIERPILDSTAHGPKTSRPEPQRDTCLTGKDQRDSKVDLTRAFTTGHFTTKEAAYYLGITPKTLWNWKCAGKIKTSYLGKGPRLRFEASELKKFIGDKNGNQRAP